MTGEVNLPNWGKSESGSPYRWGILPTEESIPQTEAAPLTQVETSLIDGRENRSVRQQSTSNFQTSSERPSSNAFPGFEGLSPPKTLKTASGPENPLDGSAPVRTCMVKINTRAHCESCGAHLVYHHCYRVYVGFLRRYALLQPES